jgi:manganese/zinc/iron transport system substrate-binding protein
MGPGVDPHLYKASEGDVRRLAEADLILYNGLHLEGKMGDILVKMARSRPVVAVGEGVPEEALREPPEFAGQYDPHVWFDVSLWAPDAAMVAEELAELDPATPPTTAPTPRPTRRSSPSSTPGSREDRRPARRSAGC